MRNITEVLIRHFMTASRFTRLYTLTGEMSDLIVTISFHRGDNYVLRKKWIRQSNEGRAITLREIGSYDEIEEEIILKSHTGCIRNINKLTEKFEVTDVESLGDYNIDGWVLYVQRA